MKIKNTIITLAANMIIFSALTPLSAEGAQSIMQKNDAIPEGKSFKRSVILLIVKSGKTEKKEFTSYSKKYGRKRRSNIQFTYPSRLGFLSWDIPGQDNQQWIKLSSGKVRKIASSEKSKPWMNSHFSNDDIAESYIEDYKYTLLGDATVSGVSCYKINSVKKRGQKIYSKTIVYIGKKDYLTYKVDFFENGRHTKTLVFSNYQTISGIPTAKKLTMSRTDGKGKSIIYIKNVVYNIPVDDRKLTREAL